MGLKISTQPLPKTEELNLTYLQNHVINYVATSSNARNWVSQHRRRLVVGGYDLDMSYITDRILAMSFPAERMRAMYRNPLWQVKSVLDMKHQGHYKVYNLCIEESYDASHFHGRVERFPFDDHHVPHFELIKCFCDSVHTWLSADPSNIAVIHCMAGKGRTGLMVSSYLVYCGMSPDEALQLYAHKRTTNNVGVSIPSQRRYVGYWGSILSFPEGKSNSPAQVNLPDQTSRELRRIRLYDTVDTEAIFFVVSEVQEIPGQMYQPCGEIGRGWCRQIKKGFQTSSSPRYYYSFFDEEDDEGETLESNVGPRVVAQMDTESSVLYQKRCLDHYFEKPVLVTGDIRVIFYEKIHGSRLFYVCFNTSFINKCLLQFTSRDLDKIGYKGKSICGPHFCLELVFGPANSKYPQVLPSCDQRGDEVMTKAVIY